VTAEKGLVPPRSRIYIVWKRSEPHPSHYIVLTDLVAPLQIQPVARVLHLKPSDDLLSSEIVVLYARLVMVVRLDTGFGGIMYQIRLCEQDWLVSIARKKVQALAAYESERMT